jgi:hypothetical protein
MALVAAVFVPRPSPGRLARHEEFVDAIIEAQRVGNTFVRGRVEAREPGFVAMWNERGGAEWFDGVTAWMEGQRSRWLEALRI